jgi:hypothetical protein
MRIDVVNAKIRLGLRLLDLHQHAPGVLRQLCSGTRLSPSQLSSLLFAPAAFGDKPQINRRATSKTLQTSVVFPDISVRPLKKIRIAYLATR